MTPAWVGPTVAISLMIIAASFLAIGGVVLALGLAIRRQSRALKDQVAKIATDARTVTSRLKNELEAFADLSADARERLKGAIESVDTRLRDLDALVEVLQEEAEETALSVASFVKTVRTSSGIIGAARRGMKKRRRGGED